MKLFSVKLAAYKLLLSAVASDASVVIRKIFKLP